MHRLVSQHFTTTKAPQKWGCKGSVSMSDDIWNRTTKMREIFNGISNLLNDSGDRWGIKSIKAPSRQVMSHRLQLIRLIWIISLISIFTCYILLSWNVSEEYFLYRTAPHIAIKDYPATNITVPELAICVRMTFQAGMKQLRVLFTGDLFNDHNDTWKIKQFVPMISSPFFQTPKMMKKVLTNKCVMRRKYCMLIKSLTNFNLDTVNARSASKAFYAAKLSTTVIHSKSFTGNRGPCGTIRLLYFSLVTDMTFLSNPRKREISKKMCIKGFDVYVVLLSYSSFVNIALPPPYDTNCRDYRKDGSFSSSHDCYDTCIKNATKKWNIVPEMVVIDRQSYKQSDAFIAYDDIIRDKDKLDKFVKDKNNTKVLRDAYRILQPKWEGIKESCRQACNRPDCWSEDFSPQIVHLEGEVNSKVKKGNHTVATMWVKLLLSHQPTLQVASVPKQQLLDYVIYMLSNLSFWIGISPLDAAQFLVRRLEEFTKKRAKMLEENIRGRWKNLFVRGRPPAITNVVRQYEERFRRQENTIRPQDERNPKLEGSVTQLMTVIENHARILKQLSHLRNTSTVNSR